MLGVALMAASHAALRLGASYPLLDSLYLSALLCLLPALAVAQVVALGDVEVDRLQAYGGSVVALVLLTGTTLLVGTRSDGAVALGLTSLPAGALIGWSALLLGGGLATLLVYRVAAGALGIVESPLLRVLIPRTPREKASFAMLSGWAGVGEEVTYRGYATLSLVPLLGPVGAAAVTSAVFGVLHAYQGVIGVLRTATLGAILAWGLLASGSLWPAMVAHVLIDLIGGLVLADRLMGPDPPRGVGEDVGRTAA